MGASESIVSLNPSTGERLAEFPCAGRKEVLQVVERARHAQPSWAALAPKERARFILAAKERLRTQRDEISGLLSRESGKTPLEALVNEVAISLDLMTYYAKRAEKFLNPKRVPLHSLILALSKKACIRYEPMGIVGVITPWNYPLSLSLGPVTCALLAGNAVVLKPSELTPQVGNKILDLFMKAGLPEGVLQVVQGAGEAGAALLEAPINKIHFTGSVATGKKVVQAAAQRLLPCDLEMGGSDPMIVCEDADLERAANAAIWGRFSNAGQTCIAVKRVLVHKSVADSFQSKLKEKISEIPVNPVISERQKQITQEQLQDSLKQGARILAAKEPPANGSGFFVPPTLISAPSSSIRALQEEVFGPVLPIAIFKDEEDALRQANSTDFGLGASVFTRSQERAYRIAARLESGCVAINDVMSYSAAMELPFAGVKSSSLGHPSHGGADGLRAFTHSKAVLADRWGAKSELYWYPYSEKKYKFFSKLFGWMYK